jgi:membrane AbrB-like protein
MVTWPLSMLALTVAMVSVTLSVMAYLKFVHGWDTLSALFASAPGALAQAMALAQDTGADVRSIAMVQTVRLFVLAVALPIAFAAFGVAGLPPPQGADAPLLRSIVELAVLVLASAGAGWFAYRFRIPGGLIVGAMAASGVLHGAGLVHAFLPVPVAIASFVVMGAMIGTRLGGADIRMLARLSLVGIGALTVGTTVGVLCAAAVAFALNLRLADVVMAYAPGAIEAMTIIAFALHLDPVFVGVHHLARFTFMSMVLPAATGLIRKYEGRGKNDEQQAPPSS